MRELSRDLAFRGDFRGGAFESGLLDCDRCGHSWPIAHGLARLFEDGELQPIDRWMRMIYDLFVEVRACLRVPSGFRYPRFHAAG
jgi:hypothetical protein